MNSIGCINVFVHIIVTYMLKMTPQKEAFNLSVEKEVGEVEELD